MKTASITALCSFLVIVSATPLAKRALVIDTVTEEFTVTVDTTTTLWVNPTKATAAPQENYQQSESKHGYSHQHLHTHVPSAPSYQAPAPAPEAQAPETAAPAPVDQASQTSSPAPVAPAPAPSSPAPVVQASEAAAPAPVPAYTAPQQSPPTSSPSPAPAPAPAPEPASQPATTSSAAPASSPTTQASSYGTSSSGGECGTAGGKCSGDMTYYDTGLGACGWTNDGRSEDVFALAHGMMGEQSNGNPFCGRMATIKVAGKAPVMAKLVDKCMGCEGQSIDLSHHLFDQLFDEVTGRLHDVEWHFNS